MSGLTFFSLGAPFLTSRLRCAYEGSDRCFPFHLKKKKKNKKRRHTGRIKQADAEGKNKKANKSWSHHKVLAVTRLFT